MKEYRKDKTYIQIKICSIVVPIALLIMTILLYPIALLLSIPVTGLGYGFDILFLNTPEVGHPFPVFTFSLLVLLYYIIAVSALIFTIATILSLVALQIVRIMYKRKLIKKNADPTELKKLTDFTSFIPLIIGLTSIICSVVYISPIFLHNSFLEISVWVFYIAVILAAAGLVLGIVLSVKRKKDNPKTDFCVSIIGMVLNGMVLLLFVVFLGFGLAIAILYNLTGKLIFK